MKPQGAPLRSPSAEESSDGYVLTYFALRRAVGYFGIGLPIAVFAVGIALPPHEFLGSISAYYYVPFAGDIFVGLLWTIGVFLWFYDYAKPDNLLTSAAGTAAIGIAVIPTAKDDIPRTLFSAATVHQICAVVFFVLLAILSLQYFTLGDPTGRPRKKTRNRIYVMCGLVMIFALVVAGIGPFVLGRETYSQLHLLFACETLASWAFGISWLVKGQRLFADLSNSGLGVPPPTPHGPGAPAGSGAARSSAQEGRVLPEGPA